VKEHSKTGRNPKAEPQQGIEKSKYLSRHYGTLFSQTSLSG
jgi:hypothetical protein